MRLIRVELSRLRWRRAVVVLLAACFVIPAVIWMGMAWNTRPYSEEEIAEVRAAYGEENAREVEHCKAHPGAFFGRGNDLSEEEVAQECEAIMGGEAGYYLEREPLSPANERTGAGAGVITILVGLVMLIGTTFVGHDWNSGSMSNQLLFDPRRPRVWLAKGAVVFGVGLLTAAIALTGWWGATALLAHARDIDVSAHDWQLIAASAGRGALLAGIAGFGAYALTMLFRSTVTTLGIMFAVSIGATILLGVTLGDRAQRWMLHTNVSAWLFDGWEYYDGSRCNGPFGGGEDCYARLSLADAATYLLAIVLIAAALSAWSFRRRDVS